MLFKEKGKNYIMKGIVLIFLVVLVLSCNLQGIDESDESVYDVEAETGGVVKASGPDLTVSTIYHTYAQLVIDQYDTFRVYVFNNGNVTSAATKLKFQIGGSLRIIDIPALTPGAHYMVSRRISFSTPGGFIITATADVYNNVAETNETNNTRQIVIRVYDYGKPDLYISSLSSSNSPKVGQFTYFVAQVKNNLQCGMSPPTKVRIKIGGETYGQVYSVPALAPGQGYSVGRGWTPSVTGGFRITAVADAENDADEKNESNNTTYISVRVSN